LSTKRRFNLNKDTSEKTLNVTMITCTGKCGKEKKSHLFYASSNPLYASTGRFPVCIACISDRLPDYRINQKDDLFKIIQDKNFINAVLNLLKTMNYPFVVQYWTSAINDAERSGKHVFGLYMKYLNKNKKIAYTYEDGDVNLSVEDICRLSVSRGLTVETLEETKKEEEKVKLKFDENDSTEITEDDISTQKDIIKLLGYDPFSGYSAIDRKYMYQELHPFLDEDTVEDQHLVNVVVQLVVNNNQVKKIDNAIAGLSQSVEALKENHTEIDKLAKTKKIIQEASTKLATENSIALKHRTDKKQGRSTLGYMMKELREYNFKDAEENYYDINKSKGMQVTAELSVKAIFDQLQFSESDYEDMLKEARDMNVNFQKQIMELEEEIRKNNVLIDAYKKRYGDLDGEDF